MLFCHLAPSHPFKTLPVFQLPPPGLPRSLRRSALAKASAATAPSRSAAPRGCQSSGTPRWIGKSPTPTSCDTWTSSWATRSRASQDSAEPPTAAVVTCRADPSFPVPSEQVNDFRSRGKQLSATEAIFVTATMQFRDTIKAMYSLPVSVVHSCSTYLPARHRHPHPHPDLSSFS